eukprot:gb/GECH01001857.1/.p1 GENE.gb/GECH01001857.1/~~gb/GECH01001857.1/.p1  ORF type:complete len:813 (+),score=185.42 gb/GECH01001857.1/:1-2439(+)
MTPGSSYRVRITAENNSPNNRSLPNLTSTPGTSPRFGDRSLDDDDEENRTDANSIDMASKLSVIGDQKYRNSQEEEWDYIQEEEVQNHRKVKKRTTSRYIYDCIQFLNFTCRRFGIWIFSLKVLLPTILVILIATTVAVVWAFTHANTTDAINTLSGKLRTQLSSRIQFNSSSEFSVPLLVNSVQLEDAELQSVEPQELETMRKIAWKNIRIFENISLIYFGTCVGNMIGYERIAPNEFYNWERSNRTNQTMFVSEIDSRTGEPVGDPVKTNEYNALQRPWYIAAEQAQEPIWSDVYLFSDGRALGVTASRPIYDDQGGLKLVTAVDRTLGILSILLNESVEDPIRAIIMERNGMLVASSEDSLFRVGERKKAIESNDTFIVDCVQYLNQTMNGDLYQLNLSETVQYKFSSSGGDTLLLDVASFSVEPNIDWLILIVIPESLFMESVEENNRFVLGFTIGTGFISALIAIGIGWFISMPLSRLSSQLQRVSNLDFDNILRGRSILLEIRRIQQSFFKMIYALQSFRKFVPDAVIKRLMTSNNVADLSLETHFVSVLFVDIANFTCISEGLETPELLKLVSEVMEELSQVIMQRKGTVDKYIGDAVMALFNVPEPIDGHPEHACMAALECREKIRDLHDGWKERGLPILDCRIGINSGRSLVGTFGSSSRLSYTAIGDSINVGARLEPLNKLYGTHILISDIVYQAVKRRYCARGVDIVRLKGRNGETMIFELLATRRKASADQLEVERLTTEAINKFNDRDIEAALMLFRQASQVNGFHDDTAIKTVVERLEGVQKAPDDKIEPLTLGVQDI